MNTEQLIFKLRNKIGDTSETNPNITDNEIKSILEDSANTYSRIKSYIKIDQSIPYDKTVDIYTLPDDLYKVKSVELKVAKNILTFIDNTNQLILVTLPEIDDDFLKITYTKYFQPEEVFDKEIDMFLLYAESLCYKLMASKTANLIDFTTGEKSVDESGISKKYLDLYECTEKKFRNMIIKSYGRKVNNIMENLDYPLPYPPEGETP